MGVALPSKRTLTVPFFFVVEVATARDELTMAPRAFLHVAAWNVKLPRIHAAVALGLFFPLIAMCNPCPDFAALEFQDCDPLCILNLALQPLLPVRRHFHRLVVGKVQVMFEELRVVLSTFIEQTMKALRD